MTVLICSMLLLLLCFKMLSKKILSTTFGFKLYCSMMLIEIYLILPFGFKLPCSIMMLSYLIETLLLLGANPHF